MSVKPNDPIFPVFQVGAAAAGDRAKPRLRAVSGAGQRAQPLPAAQREETHRPARLAGPTGHQGRPGNPHEAHPQRPPRPIPLAAPPSRPVLLL